jgi:hypothetical protein
MDGAATDFGHAQDSGLGVAVAELDQTLDEFGSAVFAP